MFNTLADMGRVGLDRLQSMGECGLFLFRVLGPVLPNCGRN